MDDLSHHCRYCGERCNCLTGFCTGCPHCVGQVVTWASNNTAAPTVQPCPHCNGTGKIMKNPDTGEPLQ